MTTITDITTDELLERIMDGRHDSDLSTINKAVVERMKDVRAKQAKLMGFKLKTGDRVSMKGLKGNVLNGQVVEVVKVKKTRVDVKAIEGVTSDAAAKQVGFHGLVSIPLTCLDIVDG